MPPSDVKDILRRYGSKIEGQIKTDVAARMGKGNYSQEYVKFKQEMAPELSKYEK